MNLFWRLKGWISVIAGVVLLALTLVSVAKYINAERLATEGVWTVATVVDKWISTDDDGDDTYHLRLNYEVEQKDFTRTATTSRNSYYDTTIGDPRDLKYWPPNPNITELREGAQHQAAIVFQIIALVVGLIGCIALWFSGSRTNSAVLARRKGIRTTATILSIVEHKNSGKPTGRGYMRFRTEDGKTGDSLTHPIKMLRRLGEGSQVVVFKRKDDVWWEGDVGPREDVPRKFPKVEDI